MDRRQKRCVKNRYVTIGEEMYACLSFCSGVQLWDDRSKFRGVWLLLKTLGWQVRLFIAVKLLTKASNAIIDTMLEAVTWKGYCWRKNYSKMLTPL